MEPKSTDNEHQQMSETEITSPVFSVYECFNSLSGEINGFNGIGQLSTFIRFSGCNLRCRWCDTLYANTSCSANTTREQILKMASLFHVTLTGGEPLLQPSIVELANELANTHQVTIETNGTRTRPIELHPSIICVMDYKLPSSQMNDAMETSSFVSLQSSDWVKFVCQDEFDFNHAIDFITHETCGTKNFAFSPLTTTANQHIITDWQQQLLELLLEYSQLPQFQEIYIFHFSIQVHKLIGVR